MENIFVRFEQGEKGLICKSTPDRGPWIVPARGCAHKASIVAGRDYCVEITGTSKAGNLRFCKVIADMEAHNEAMLQAIQVGLPQCAQSSSKNLGEASVSGGVVDYYIRAVSSYIGFQPFQFSEAGKLQTNSVRAFCAWKQGGWWQKMTHGDSYFFESRVQLDLSTAKPITLVGKVAQYAMASLLYDLAEDYRQPKSLSIPEFFMPTLQRLQKLWRDVFAIKQRDAMAWVWPRIASFEECIEFSPKFARDGRSNSQRDISFAEWILAVLIEHGADDLQALQECLKIPHTEEILQQLIQQKPNIVRLSGQEFEIHWSGNDGSVYVDEELFNTAVILP